MHIITDNPDYATSVLGAEHPWTALQHATGANLPTELIEAIFRDEKLSSTRLRTGYLFQYMLITEHSELSQYDLSIQLLKDNVSLPHGILVFAGSGSRFHGLRNRDWNSPPGNIYLTTVFTPNRRIEHFGPACVALPAVAVCETIASFSALTGRTSIKWVNDILIDDAKVAGVLTYSQAMGDEVTGIVLGIGLNVETTPEVEPTPFVPKAGSMSQFAGESEAIRLPEVLTRLIENLDETYRQLESGDWHRVVDQYKALSVIIGRPVTVLSDSTNWSNEIIAEGVVETIGDDLELHIRGIERPVSRGRLIIKG